MKQAEQERSKERSRAEAAGRRLERARSRRNDGGELHNHIACTAELMSATEVDQNEDGTPNPPASNRASPPAHSSQPPTPPPAEKPPQKRGPGKKPVKKLGNNQYTKRNLELAASSPFGRKRHLQNQATLSGDESHDAANGEVNGIGTANGKTSPGAAENGHTNGTGKPKFGRKKNAMANGNNANKTTGGGEEIPRTFGNMSAALNNMNTYVLRQQAETAPSANSEATSPAEDNASTTEGNRAPAPEEAVADQAADKIEVLPPEEWEKLSAPEMAAMLQRNIAKWQRLYGPLAAPIVPSSS